MFSLFIREAIALFEKYLFFNPLPLLGGVSLGNRSSINNRGGLLISEQNPEECDATEAQSRNRSWVHKFTHPNLLKNNAYQFRPSKEGKNPFTTP
jgi:hypothetical protein